MIEDKTAVVVVATYRSVSARNPVRFKALLSRHITSIFLLRHIRKAHIRLVDPQNSSESLR